MNVELEDLKGAQQSSTNMVCRWSVLSQASTQEATPGFSYTITEEGSPATLEEQTVSQQEFGCRPFLLLPHEHVLPPGAARVLTRFRKGWPLLSFAGWDVGEFGS